MTYNYSCYHFTDWINEGHITQAEFIVIAVLNGVTILPNIFLNFMVLVSIWRTPTLHTPALVLIFNLALSDLSVGFISQPVILAWNALEFDAAKWPKLYCGLCVSFGFTSTMFGSLSLLSLTAVAVDRYLALRLHLRYSAVCTMKRSVDVCVALWVVSLCVAISWFLVGNTIFNIILNSCMAICFNIIISCYFHIYRILKKHQRQIRGAQTLGSFQNSTSQFSSTSTASNVLTANIKQYQKSVIHSLYIYFFFILCYMPCSVALAYFELSRDNRRSPSFVKIFTCIVLANSAINPCIYCWKMRELRTAVRHTLLGLREITGIGG
ncbi:histamine H2 receptor-like [Nematostella vectensis]|uniref:histamine H2 receptor-like n=1 Tax=Nematostella vectensis TaxID=45351 RepID=UPI00138FCC3D|nr:histamine H2 receptor-like [Nematostella vectensis]